ncbi:MAG: T9SS type A sorting domain-containing protein [Bacteroidia bacterium]
MKKTLLFYFILAFFATKSYAQCLMYEVPLTERVQKAEVIVEGEVLHTRSFWNESKTMIYTEYYIEISTVLKEKVPTPMPLSAAILQVEGGQVEDFVVEVEPSLHLNIGDKGIFFLTEKHLKPYYRPIFEPYADVQGFIRYETDAKSATDVFAKYDISKLRKEITHFTHFTPIILNPLTLQPPKNTRGPAISSFSPANLSVGTGEILTITGSGFGTKTGSAKVQFTDPDYQAVTFSDAAAADYLSWTDTEIKLTMNGGNAGAGTGKIKVFDAAGTSASSTNTLTVPFHRQRGDLGNDNGTGGYTFQFNNEFAQNPSAVAAVTRAIESWRCATGVNFGIGTNTAVDTNLTTDNVNVIRWGVLSSGLLGKCYWSYNICSSTNYDPRKDIDVTFASTNASWNFGPAATPNGKSDLESVALHELGHGLGLGHVSNAGHSMFPVIMSGTDVRTPAANGDELGGEYVVNFGSNVTTVCNGIGKMIPLNANNCAFTTDKENALSPYISIQPNPNQGRFYLTMGNMSQAKISIWNSLGQKVADIPNEEKVVQEVYLQGISSGIYYVKVSVGSKTWEQKMVVE